MNMITAASEPCAATLPKTIPKRKPQHSREAVCATVVELHPKTADKGPSRRSVGRAHDIPESTLRGWCARWERTGLSPEALAFFESPEGLKFLRRVEVALLLVFGVMGGCGPSRMRMFLTLVGLAPLMACSVSYLRRRMDLLLGSIAKWGEAQRDKLASGMPRRSVSLGADETFFKDMILVAADLVSGFLLVEKASETRDAATWNKAVDDGLKGLNVEVFQLVGDAATQLKALARDMLGVPKIEDLFHGQMPITRGMSGPLATQVRKAQEALVKAAETLKQVQEARARYEGEQKHGPGRPPGWDAREAKVLAQQQQAKEALAEASQRQEQVREATRALGTAVHPVNLETGALQEPAEVQAQLDDAFDRIKEAADEAGLSDKSHAKIRKAKRMAPSWVDLVQRWFLLVQIRLVSLALPGAVLAIMIDVVIPAVYLGRVLAQTTDTTRVDALREVRANLLRRLKDPNGVWLSLPRMMRVHLVQAAQDCVDMFQRSTSSIEGRNGYLSLHHHGLRGLRPAMLAALTVIHNYVLQRADGTTAAERFFGRPPEDLFEHLCEVIPAPGRPRRRPNKPAADEFQLAA